MTDSNGNSEAPAPAGAELSIGADVSGSDAALGKLIWVVVDPVGRVLTHLVVEPAHHLGPARLVPIDLVDAPGDPIRLRATQADFGRLEPAEETHFLPDAGGSFGYGAGQAMAWPYYGLSGAGFGGIGLGAGAVPQPIVYDRVPLGEVQVRRGDRVHASDGSIGSVHGLVIDPSTHHVTHVLLQEGHLWGRKQVAIPITAVSAREEGGELHVALSKDEIRDLPPVDLGG